MLTDRYLGALSSLTPFERYHPFPTAGERLPWETLPRDLRQEVITCGEQLLGYAWPPLAARPDAGAAPPGDSEPHRRAYFARRDALAALVLAECVEGRGRFLADILHGLRAIAEEHIWRLSLLAPSALSRSPDAFAAETAAGLAWTCYLLGPALDAADTRLTAQVRADVERRVLDPYLDRERVLVAADGEDCGLRCTANCLAAALLLQSDPARRRDAVTMALRDLDDFFTTCPGDGRGERGPGQWALVTGALLDCTELLHEASGGAIDLAQEPLVGEIGRALCRAHISGNHFLSFGDCSPEVHLPPDLLYCYGRRIGDRSLMGLGAWVYRRNGGISPTGPSGARLRGLPGLCHPREIAGPGEPPYLRDVWFGSPEVMAARTRGGTDRGLYLAAKGGDNGGGHCDSGSFVVYCDGQPVLVDPGVGEDTRGDSWVRQSAFHNLPTVNGAEQGTGGGFAARSVQYRADDAGAELSFELAAAYLPEAGLTSWHRTCRLHRRGRASVEVCDAFALGTPTRDLALSLITPCAVEIRPPREIALRHAGGDVVLGHDEGLRVSVEAVDLSDAYLREVWAGRLHRVLLRPREPVMRGRWVLTIRRA